MGYLKKWFGFGVSIGLPYRHAKWCQVVNRSLNEGIIWKSIVLVEKRMQ